MANYSLSIYHSCCCDFNVYSSKFFDSVAQYCIQRNNSYNSYLKKKAIRIVAIFFIASYVIYKLEKTSLNIPGTVTRNTANLRETLKFLCLQ